jgi:hypothetical protein
MKPVKLKNRYNGEIVYCKDIKDIVQDRLYTFIKVYKPELPGRIYLVNKDAYVLETK